MAACPNCSNPMTLQSYDARTAPRPIEIDACPTCRLLWFDQWESNNLAPRGVLTLFQYIGAATMQPAIEIKANMNCIRCRVRLDPTRDLQRTTPFTYWRCGKGHGRLITFHQFLREKNFIRTPSPPELARLRETIRQISCSQCGAPINLATDNACPHCAAPIAMIDPDSVARAIKELNTASSANDINSPSATKVISDAQIDAMFELERTASHHSREADFDLVTIGAQAIGAAIGIFLSS